MQAKYRRLREAAYAEGRKSFDELARDPSFRDFVCLYLAEGYKRDRNCVSVCNSDPTVVVLCHAWICRLSTHTPDYSVQYHADQDLEELRGFWSAQLGIRPDQVRMQRKSNSNQLAGRTWRSRPRRARRPGVRHAAAREARGLDGQAARVLALDCAFRGVAQPGSAPPLGGGGHRFESGRPD